MTRTTIITAALLLQYSSICPASPIDDAWPLADRVAWQASLDAAGFSPGVVDGRIGRKTETATREFQYARGLQVTGVLDTPTARALGWDSRTAFTTCTIQAEDLAQVGHLPKDWNEKARLTRLPYPSLEELVAERYHCSRALLAELNPGKSMANLRAGDTLKVPAVRPPAAAPAVAALQVHLNDKIVRAVTADGKTAAMFNCSVAADARNFPSGRTSVVIIQENPAYSFDPAKWPEVHNVSRKLLIPPGPRNPVGLCWIGLGLAGYGIHGTPAPENIGKTGSHGCIRLTNWDALRLGKMVRVGTPVTFK
ncbi:MAG: putative L,D-transpeptidase YkuD [Planctomycetes bacterium ADurb.Bin126]|nr:MAG: putative L,D-transpeptidase YkuD [Planctomycetes bacterium ADurb.Bin126]HOD80847.1 L,D-transpeptidase [Phycisphaerae bacterium]HQL74829.1 L,D-transpeptidase [Phycisphaerae bacterium]